MSTVKTCTVQSGNTLSAIARHFGKTVEQLKQYNHLESDAINAGQVLKLEQDPKDLSFQTLFLDALRIPIEGLEYLLKFDGKEVKGKTQASGLGEAVQTKRFDSMVEVWVKRMDNTWKQLGQVSSGYGAKLLTLVSPNLAFKVKTEKLPPDPQPEVQPAYSKDRPPPAKAQGTPIKPGHPLTLRKGKEAGVVVLEVDLPEELIAYFKGYKEELITEGDWNLVAGRLGCEPEVLKAFAKVESGGRSAYWQLRKPDGLHVPVILYERHYFHRLTNGAYDTVNPDVSWKVGYLHKTKKTSTGKVSLIGMNNAEVQQTLGDKQPRDYTHDNRVDEADVYSSNAASYLRLLNAYRLDKDAALKSVSWGKFQIMGAEHVTCGKPSLIKFVETMCSGEKGQLDLLAAYIQNKPAVAVKDKSGRITGYRKSLHQAFKDKDWRVMAYYYNGANYAADGYHTKLEDAYNQYKKESS